MAIVLFENVVGIPKTGSKQVWGEPKDSTGFDTGENRNWGLGLLCFAENIFVFAYVCFIL